MGKFDYARYFGDILPLADATRRAEHRFWEPPARGKSPSEYVLYLGCNVLRTVHLAETLLEVLADLNVDVQPVGGPAYCCGIVHHRQNDTTVGDSLTGHTMRNFNRLAPREVLVYCPSCHAHMDDRVPERHDLRVPYRHVTDFLAERVDRIRWRKPVPRKVALHHHPHSPQQARDAKAVLTLLRAVPELEVVELPVGEEWGRHCTGQHIEELGRQRFDTMVSGAMADAESLDCDVLATVYHSCYRELCGYERKDGPELLNYIDLVAEGMGLDVPEAAFKRMKLAGDPEAAHRELEPVARKRNANHKRLEASLASHFTPPSS